MTNTYNIPLLENGEVDLRALSYGLNYSSEESCIEILQALTAHATAKERERCIKLVQGLEIKYTRALCRFKPNGYKQVEDFRKAAITAIGEPE
jgi:hypothetical protein